MTGKRHHRRTNNTNKMARQPLERLEGRLLFAVGASSTPLVPILAHTAQPSADTILLTSKFADPNIPGTVVKFDTTLGTFDVALSDTATPITVKNFLSYVNSGAYNGTIIHRNAVLSASPEVGGSPTKPAEIVQGGGYKVDGNTITHIKTSAAITDESTLGKSNVLGTLSMAKTSAANSATSEWFFNSADNSSTLAAGGYTAFGTVLGNGMKVVNGLAALPTTTLKYPRTKGSTSGSKGTATFTEIPLAGLSEKQAKNKHTIIGPGNLTYVNSVTVIPGLTFTATSDNPALVRPIVSGTSLSFQYDGTKTGVANVTVVATDIDGSKFTQTFAVSVPNSAAATQGPVAANDTPANVYANSTTSINVIANDSDSVAALKPTSILIATQPGHGTATVDASTGLISYKPVDGYTGPDSFIYTVSDAANVISNPATVSFTVSDTPATVTIGTKTAHDLTYTEPDGTVSHVSVSGGTAQITFASSTVTQSTKSGHVTASGAGATIASIQVVDSKNHRASLSFSARGGTDNSNTVGSITNGGPMLSITGTHTNLAGNLNVSGIRQVSLANTTNSTLTIGNDVPATRLNIVNASETSVVATGDLRSIKSKAWTSTSTVNSISAQSIGKIQTTGNFSDSLILSGTGKSALGSAHIGGALNTAGWTAKAGVGMVTAKTVGSGWSFSSTARADGFQFGSNLAGSITASELGTLKIKGNFTSTITTTAAFDARKKQIDSVYISGEMTAAKIAAVGNIGSIKAGSMTGTNIYAGVDSGTVTGNIFPAAAANFVAKASIQSVKLGKANPAFSNNKISADIIHRLALGNISSSNGGTTEGVAGHTIDHITGTLSNSTKLNLGPAQLKSAAALTAYIAKKKITLNDFAVNIL